jgi:D-arginine dehydrogenase
VDDLAALAGATTIGIMPLRRTIFMLAAPDGLDTSRLPLAGDIDGTFYVKPEGPQLLCSPADEVLQPPGDARPDELEIARALDAIEAATTLTSRHVRTSWAGLRNFTPDRVPVVGFDPAAEGFFWFAGQGGYGIQTAPAMARTGAALIRGSAIPEDIAIRGVDAAALAPDRPGISILATH